MESFVGSSDLNTRTFGQKIKHILEIDSATFVDADYAPGGQHDNDFPDFKKIAILPTADEISSKEPPFLRSSSALEDPETEKNRMAIYLDNQFRLLREDMISEIREELQIILGEKKGRHKGLAITGLHVLGVHSGDLGRRCKWGVMLKCQKDLPQLQRLKAKDRLSYLTEHRKILAHQSLTCLIADGQIVAFPVINRNEDLLAQNPPVIILQFGGDASARLALTRLKTAGELRLIQVNTAVFSFEPILRAIQETTSIPFSQELLLWKTGAAPRPPSSQATSIVQAISADPHQDLGTLLKTPKAIKLDRSQAKSLISGLTQSVSLIQGPPGI